MAVSYDLVCVNVTCHLGPQWPLFTWLLLTRVSLLREDLPGPTSVQYYCQARNFGHVKTSLIFFLWKAITCLVEYMLSSWIDATTHDLTVEKTFKGRVSLKPRD